MDEKYLWMLLTYKDIFNYEKIQMDNMMKVDIRTTHVFGLFARQAGGHDKG